MNQSTEANDINCQQLTTGTQDILITNACQDQWLIHMCAPVFISVEGSGSTTEDISFRCLDNAECRFPDNLRFSIHTENLGCTSGVVRIFSTVALVLVSLFVVFNI